MSAPCREEIRSSNEKSLLLLALIANKFRRREYIASVKLAEGEELGSNLLQVIQLTPASWGR